MELKEVTAYLKDLTEAKSLRARNDSYMKLNEYHRFTDPKELISSLYF
jgi:hypothetical protein